MLGLGVVACGDDEERITAGLIIKQDTNPFFVKIEDVAKKTAGDENVELLTAAGKSDVDNESQVAALEDMTERGAKGILITPAELGGRRARDREGAPGRRDRDRPGHADRPGVGRRRAVRDGQPARRAS